MATQPPKQDKQDKPDKTAKRDADIVNVGAQLKQWLAQIDDLVAGYLAVGARESDPYRLRIDALRSRHSAVQARFDELNGSKDGPSRWAAFRTAIVDDWAALLAGFKDLTVTPAVPAAPTPAAT
jgi:hypothetical protein